MELAHRAGLNVARTELTQALDRRALLVERFDRIPETPLRPPQPRASEAGRALDFPLEGRPWMFPCATDACPTATIRARNGSSRALKARPSAILDLLHGPAVLARDLSLRRRWHLPPSSFLIAAPVPPVRRAAGAGRSAGYACRTRRRSAPDGPLRHGVFHHLQWRRGLFSELHCMAQRLAVERLRQQCFKSHEKRRRRVLARQSAARRSARAARARGGLSA